MSSSKAYMQEYNKRYYLLHKEDIKGATKKYRNDNLEKVRMYGRNHAKTNKVTYNLRAREWYQEHKQLMIDRAKAWKKNNKQKVQANTRSYASRRAGAPGSFTTKDFLRLFNRLRGLCGYCFKNKADTIDHKQPLSRGGSNYIGNILPACGSCNYSKQSKTIMEWRYGRVVCTRSI